MSEAVAPTIPSSDLKKGGGTNGSAAHEPEVEEPTNGHHDEDDADEGEESDEYDFEEEQQAVEGEDDEYVDLGDEEENEDAGNQQHNGKSNLTALLLGDPNVVEDEEEHDDQYGNDDGEDADDYEADGNEEEEEDDYVEPITPTTAKKRSLDEALEEAASPREENEFKKIKA